MRYKAYRESFRRCFRILRFALDDKYYQLSTINLKKYV